MNFFQQNLDSMGYLKKSNMHKAKNIYFLPRDAPRRGVVQGKVPSPTIISYGLRNFNGTLVKNYENYQKLKKQILFIRLRIFTVLG